MANLTEYTQFSGALADDDLFLVVDASAADPKDRKMPAATLRQQMHWEALVTTADSTAAHEIDCSLGTVHQVTLTAACTFTFSNVPTGVGFRVTLELIQDATGSRTVTWPAAVTWAGGAAPTLSTAAAAVDLIELFTLDDGTTWRGIVLGQAFA